MFLVKYCSGNALEHLTLISHQLKKGTLYAPRVCLLPVHMVPGCPVVQCVKAEREVLVEVYSVLFFRYRVMIGLNNWIGRLAKYSFYELTDNNIFNLIINLAGAIGALWWGVKHIFVGQIINPI